MAQPTALRYSLATARKALANAHCLALNWPVHCLPWLPLESVRHVVEEGLTLGGPDLGE
jgi:hypothetical protein